MSSEVRTVPDSATKVTHRPTALGSMLSVVAAVATVRLVAPSSSQFTPLAAVAGAAVVFAVGSAVRDRGSSFAGWSLVLVGVVAALGAVGYSVVAPPTFAQKIVLLPGVLGVAFVAVSFVPLRTGWERRVLAVGIGWLLASVMMAAVMNEATKMGMLGGMAAAILSWDAGKQAISLGEQVGREAETKMVSVVHSLASSVVAALAVGASIWLYDLNVTGVSLAGLALLLGAAITLAIALYN
ncbi:DUF7519 family protein [Halorussus halophilus]|uniref:DUF7519 family protein n=1 Tax=Halorussus halophilus TaxID=2650975 RepID=UPI001300D9FD|nr:hypothetical protein [Halorussus halophilus]